MMETSQPARSPRGFTFVLASTRNENCETVVLEAGPEFKILAVNKLEGSNGLSSPAVVGREIFLRTSDAIYCVTKLE